MNPFHKQRLFGTGLLVLLISAAFVIYTTRTSLPLNLSQISPLSAPQALSALTQIEAASPAPIEPTTEATAIELPTIPPPEPAATIEPLVTAFPTAFPTPIITPIPISTPPYIDGLEAQQPQPFWMYWAQGDELWRIDNQGQTAELVVDTFVATGSHLLGPAPEGQGTDCCPSTHYFAIAPDQQKFALVTIDQEQIDAAPKPPPYGSAPAIHIYDMKLRTSLSLGSGIRPLWSPDSKQIGFWRGGNLWIANVETGEVTERIKPQPDKQMYIGQYVWSPDSTQIVFMYEQGFYQPIPTIWVLALASNSEPKAVLNKDHLIMNLKWAPDGKSIYYVSSEGAKDFYPFHQVQNLWKVSLSDGTAQPMTNDMVVSDYGFLPGHPWLYLTSIRLYESALDTAGYYNTWLLNSEDGTLRRLTAGEESWSAVAHTPEGASLLVSDNSWKPQLLSLVDGSLTRMDERLSTIYSYGGPNYTYGGAK